MWSRAVGMVMGKGIFLLLLLEVPAYHVSNTMVLLSAAAAEVKTGGILTHSSCSLSVVHTDMVSSITSPSCYLLYLFLGLPLKSRGSMAT